jgi:hypothetical protein
VEKLGTSLSDCNERVSDVRIEKKEAAFNVYRSNQELIRLRCKKASLSSRFDTAKERAEWSRADMLQKQLMDYPEKIRLQQNAAGLSKQRLFEASRSLSVSVVTLGGKFTAVDEDFVSFQKSVEKNSAESLKAHENAADATKKLRSDFESLHLETQQCAVEEYAINDEKTKIQTQINMECDYERLNIARYA